MASVLNRQGCDDTIGAGRGEGYRELLKTRLRLLLPSLPGNRLAHIRTVGRSTEPSPAAPSTSRTQSLSLRTSGQRLSRPAWSCPQTQTASAMRVQHLTALRTHQINQQVNAILATDEVKAQLRALDKPLLDHDLTGDYVGTRECHIAPDWLLIYMKNGDLETGSLKLIRTGSHSDLF